MTTVAGLTPGERGNAALHLGAMVARSNGDDLAASRPFWQPEGNDPTPQTLAAMLAMKAAPNLLKALEKCAGLLPRIAAYDGVYREAIAAINEATELPAER